MGLKHGSPIGTTQPIAFEFIHRPEMAKKLKMED